MTNENDLRVGRYTIPGAELHWTFSTSGGPGGQHANKSATRAELRFDLASSDVFDPDVKERLLDRLRSIGDGVLVISVDESRSQWRNRAIARRRLSELLTEALKPRKRRRPTKPSAAARRRRLEEKRHRSEIKRLRRPPE